MLQMTYADVLKMLVGLRDQTRQGAVTDDAGDQRAFLGFALRNIDWSRAQFLQDLWVAYELKSRRHGFFVEFGATDGITYSNSHGLETHLGWSGILAEPARVWYPAIRHNRGCAIDDRCVWTRSGETLRFNQPAIAAHSTIDLYSDHDDLAHTRTDGLRYDVTTVSLTDLLAHWRAPRRIDYLSLDTEGSELEILEAFDWDAHEFRLITVEHNFTPKREQIHALLTGRGYRRKFEALSDVDDWYVKTY